MREVRRQIEQGRRIIRRSRGTDLTAEEVQHLIGEYESTCKETGVYKALFDLISDVYLMGAASGYKCSTMEAERNMIREYDLEDGFTWHLKTVRHWKSLEVIEANLFDEIGGTVVPWGKPGRYRIFINNKLPERKKTEVFIHEMIHLYRGDLERQGESIKKIEEECNRLTREIMEKMNL